MVRTLIVHLWTLPTKEAEDQMRATLKTAKDIYLKDSGTHNWFIMQDPKDSTAWSIVERYEDEDAVKTHFANPHFQQFMIDVRPITDPAKATQILTYEEF
ncbi:hypothetical protein B0H14DRAFT_2739964 [Mycena olivaceomarginata]|nr:hypothetical protein B0H14DRAFT_2739964 [Mycena olivaceomarginata]